MLDNLERATCQLNMTKVYTVKTLEKLKIFALDKNAIQIYSFMMCLCM